MPIEDREELNRLNRHMGLIHIFARSYYPSYKATRGSSVEYDDLLQEFKLEVFKALKRYDPSLGFAESTFVSKALINRISQLRTHVTRKKRALLPGQRIVSLDAPIRHGNNSSFVEFVVDEAARSTEEKACTKIMIEKYLSHLKGKNAQRYKLIMKLRAEGATLEEIAIQLPFRRGRPITPERVRQLEEKALKHIKAATISACMDW